MIEIKIIYDDQPSGTDWIPEHALQETLAEIAAAGLKARVVGRVSWQRQLAAMEDSAAL